MRNSVISAEGLYYGGGLSETFPLAKLIAKASTKFDLRVVSST